MIQYLIFVCIFLVLAIAVAAVYCLSVWLYRLLEWACRRASRRIKERRKGHDLP